MQRTMLKSKLHRATVTHSELEYEGSCAIDSSLLRAADIKEYEQISIYNITNGERFVTYAIRAEKDSGIISINGAAAHKASPGDKLIIATYADYNESELETYHPTLVYLDESNKSHKQNSSKLIFIKKLSLSIWNEIGKCITNFFISNHFTNVKVNISRETIHRIKFQTLYYWIFKTLIFDVFKKFINGHKSSKF